MFHLKDRLRAAGIHFGWSALVAVLVAVPVFTLWYPHPYREISGGRHLFVILVVVNLILGPALTFAVYSRTKARYKMIFDFVVIGSLQVAALVYGMATVFVARPVHLVFETDRFTVLHAVEVGEESLVRASSALRELPLAGPTVIALRPFAPGAETLSVTMTALGGVNIAALPEYWVPYESVKERVLSRAKPMAQLKDRFSGQHVLIDKAAASTGRPVDQLLWLPLTSRTVHWTALLDRQSAQVVGFIPLDSY